MNNKDRLTELENIFRLLAESMDIVDLEIKTCHEINESPAKYYQIHHDLEELIDNAYESSQQIINRLGGLAHYQLPQPRNVM